MDIKAYIYCSIIVFGAGIIILAYYFISRKVKKQNESLVSDFLNAPLFDKEVIEKRKKEKIEKSCNYLKSQNVVFVLFVKKLEDQQIPMITERGAILVFTDSEKASKAINLFSIELCIMQFTQSEFREFVKSCYARGYKRIVLNYGLDVCTGEIEIDDGEIEIDECFPDPKAKGWDYYGSALRMFIARYLICLTDNRYYENLKPVFFDGIIKQLYKTVFVVPIVFGDETDTSPDMTLHLTQNAAELMTSLEIERELGDESGPGVKIAAQDDKGNQQFIINTNLLIGAEDYRLASSDEANAQRKMHLRYLCDKNEDKFLCGFTDCKLIRAFFGNDVIVGLYTYEEIISFMNGKDYEIAGFVINPNAENFVMPLEMINSLSKQQEEIENSKV